jgi:hypothetical protein
LNVLFQREAGIFQNSRRIFRFKRTLEYSVPKQSRNIPEQQKNILLQKNSLNILFQNNTRIFHSRTYERSLSKELLNVLFQSKAGIFRNSRIIFHFKRILEHSVRKLYRYIKVPVYEFTQWMVCIPTQEA